MQTKLHEDFALSPSVGNVQKYESGKWRDIPAEDRLKMTKLEGQVWIALLNLLFKPECQRKYDFNNFNKNQLLKVPHVTKKSYARSVVFYLLNRTNSS